MKYPGRRQQKRTKKRYRVRNWGEYDRALQQRGDLTLWFSEAGIRAWRARSTGRPGGQRVYARTAIEAALTVRLVYDLALRLVSLSADGAYDKVDVYEAAASHAACRGRAVPRFLIPPCRPAQLVAAPTVALAQRNRKLRSVRKRGRRRWHKASGYSRWSLVETAMFRFKHIIGRALRARTVAGQQVEVVLGCRVLNG